MRRGILIVSFVCLLALAPVGAWAQSSGDADAVAVAAPEPGAGSAAAVAQQPGTVSRIYLLKPKVGMAAEFQAAAAEHAAWHRDNNDPWTWIAFYIETGKNTGMYGYVTPGHEWADFDTYDATIGPADTENANATMGPYEESYTSSFAVALPGVSNPAPVGSSAPMVNVIHYGVDLAKQADFIAILARAHAALQQGGFAGHYTWSMQANGGEGLVFTLVLPLNSWADMAAPERTVPQIFEEVLGRHDGQQIMSDFAGALVSTESWIARILPELSHIPGQ